MRGWGQVGFGAAPPSSRKRVCSTTRRVLYARGTSMCCFVVPSFVFSTKQRFAKYLEAKKVFLLVASTIPPQRGGRKSDVASAVRLVQPPAFW